VVRWCGGSRVKRTDGVFRVREDEPAADRGGDASNAVRVTEIWPPQPLGQSWCLVNNRLRKPQPGNLKPITNDALFPC